MFRQLAVPLRAVGAYSEQYTASLGAAGACELSASLCSGVDRAIPSSGSADTLSVFRESNPCVQGLYRLPPRPTARLEIWRHCTTTAPMFVPQRPAVFLASTGAPKSSSEMQKKKPAASKAGPRSGKQAGSSTRTSKPKATRAKKSARGHAVAERRKSTNQDKVKAAQAAAKARAAESIAKLKEREAAITKKLRAEIKLRVAEAKAKAEEDKAKAIAKVKADADEKLRAALKKADAKVARAEAKAPKRVKRAPSALNLYIREQMAATSQLSLQEATQRFKELSIVEKQKYIDQAAAAKAEVQQERQKLAAERTSRRAVSAYFFFSNEQRPQIVASSPNMSLIEITKRVAEQWRGLSAEQRQKYIDMSEADRKAKGLAPSTAKAATKKPAAVQSAIAQQ